MDIATAMVMGSRTGTSTKPKHKGTHPILLNLFLTEIGIPTKMRNVRLDQFAARATPDQTEAINAAKDFVKNLPDHYVTNQRPIEDYPEDRSTMGRGLLFAGPPGTGKSTLAILTLQEIYMTYHLKELLYITSADMLALRLEKIQVEKEANKGDPASLERLWYIDQKLERAWDAPVLVLDDVGKEHTKTEFASSEIDRILRHRFVATTPTIITTNVESDGWVEKYDASLRSFIKEGFERITIDGNDLRGEG
jgi:DNA replication protein DnaC